MSLKFNFFIISAYIKYKLKSIIKQFMSLNDFEVLSQIGDGFYSTVYKVKRIYDSHIYALKKAKLVDLSDKEINHAVNQVRMLASIRHPNIIGYKQAFYDLPSKSLCIVMQFADGGDLESKITDHRNKGLYLKEDYIWDVFGQILTGLSKLHDLGILHRDMKSANVYMMRNGLIKIGDLNVSKIVRRDGMCETQTGAPYYSSPEVWRKQAYDIKADAWSLGCILYELINLKLPFRARDMEGLYKKVNRGFYPRINKSYSEQLAFVVKKLLTIDPVQRISCRQLLEMPLVTRNMKKPRDADLQEKSILLKTIKVGKNISYIGQKLPLPNYTPLRYNHNSLGKIQNNKIRVNRSLSQSLDSKNSSLLKQRSLNKSKVTLPPVPNHPTSLIKNNSKIGSSVHVKPSKSPKRQISSQKVNPRYKKSRASYIESHNLNNLQRYKNNYP